MRKTLIAWGTALLGALFAWADTTAPNWKPVTQPDTIIGYYTVKDAQTQVALEADGSKLGVFSSSGECRGVAEIMQGPVGKLFQITIGVASSSEMNLSFKVWDAGSGVTYDVKEKIESVAGVETIGTIAAPSTLTCGGVIPPQPTKYMVTFDLGAHGTRTGGGELEQQVESGKSATAPTFSVGDGWEFTGWDKSFASVTSDMTVTAQYAPLPVPSSYTISYVGLEGAANTNVTTFTTNDLPLALGPVEREGYKFLGWTPWDGVIPAGTASNVTFTALWEALAPVNPDEPRVIVDPAPTAEDVVPVKAEEVTAALAYNGYLAKGDEIVGSVTVKVAKKAKVTATVQLPDGSGSKALKKFSYAGTLGENGSVELSCKKNGGTMFVTIGAKALSGKVEQGGETYAINGRLGTKDELSSVDSLLDKKVWTVALHTPSNGVPHALVNGYSALTVTGGKKGKVKVAGFLADGTKVSVSAQGTVFGSCVIVPVNAALYKGKVGGFSLKLKIEGEKIEVGNVSDWTAVVDGSAVTVKWDAVPASAKSDIGSDARFHMDAADIPFDDVVPPSADGTSTLPDGVKVDSVGGKWSLPKAGKVAFTKDKSDLDVSKFGENPAGLKLSYAAKTGAFKGSFSLYRQTAPGKLKKEKATVNGVVVKGVGYGSAVIKKTGAMPVTVGAGCGECQP